MASGKVKDECKPKIEGMLISIKFVSFSFSIKFFTYLRKGRVGVLEVEHDFYTPAF